MVADVPEGDVAGALSRVPALPLRYVVRDELDGLVDAVVGTQPAVPSGSPASPPVWACTASAGSASPCLPLPWPPTTGSAGGFPAACTG